MKARPSVLPNNRQQNKNNPRRIGILCEIVHQFVLQAFELPVVKQFICLSSADYAHNVSVSDSEFGTNGSDRGKVTSSTSPWALEKCVLSLSSRFTAPQSFVRSQTLNPETTAP